MNCIQKCRIVETDLEGAFRELMLQLAVKRSYSWQMYNPT